MISTVNLLLSTVLMTFSKFWCVCIFIQFKVFWFLPFQFLHWLTEDFPKIFLYATNLFRFIEIPFMAHNMFSLGKCLCALRTNVYPAVVGWRVYKCRVAVGWGWCPLFHILADLLCTQSNGLLRGMFRVSSDSWGLVYLSLQSVTFYFMYVQTLVICPYAFGIVVSSWWTHHYVLSLFIPPDNFLCSEVCFVWYYCSHLSFLLISVFAWYIFFCPFAFNYFCFCNFPTRLCEWSLGKLRRFLMRFKPLPLCRIRENAILSLIAVFLREIVRFHFGLCCFLWEFHLSCWYATVRYSLWTWCSYCSGC